jgi:hypothetical protein
LTKNELAYNFTFHEKLLILLPLSFLLANLQKSSYTLPSIEAVFPNTQIQLCIIHVIRNALAYVSYKDLKAVVADLKLIYQAVTETEAQFALELFADKWLARYSMAVQVWKSNWKHIRTFFAFPMEIRKPIYTTNAIESLNFSLRKVTRNRALFPNDDAVFKLFYLAIKNISKTWTMPIRKLILLTYLTFSLTIAFLCLLDFIYRNLLTPPVFISSSEMAQNIIKNKFFLITNQLNTCRFWLSLFFAPIWNLFLNSSLLL